MEKFFRGEITMTDKELYESLSYERKNVYLKLQNISLVYPTNIFNNSTRQDYNKN